jgi:hypothetical protein
VELNNIFFEIKFQKIDARFCNLLPMFLGTISSQTTLSCRRSAFLNEKVQYDARFWMALRVFTSYCEMLIERFE